MKAAASNPGQGATLVELVIAISLLGIVIVPLTMMLSASASRSADSMVEIKVIELGGAYIEEILSKRFDENSAPGGLPPCSIAGTNCGPIGSEAGETRPLYDDVDDYDGLVDLPPLDSLGNPRPGYDRYQVAVAVRYATAAEVAGFGLDGVTDAKKIEVQVSPPSGTTVTFDVYRGNF